MPRISLDFFDHLSRYTAAVMAVRAEIRTEREIENLPAYLRKDIGWPDRQTVRGGPPSRR